MKRTSVIWDWNGTLLNDLDFCIATINQLLQKRNLPLLTRETYKEVFSFPVKNYYAAIGFDFSKEDFAVPAREFIDLYDHGVKRCELHQAGKEIIAFFKEAGARQFVLSAMKQNMLEHTLKYHAILSCFEGVAGLMDHYAASKVKRGKELISQFNIETENAWMIGDTIHDLEVAQELGIRCILVSDGHQSVERLKRSGALVVNNLFELKELKH